MPASTLDAIGAAICTSLAKAKTEKNGGGGLDGQLVGATRRALLADVEFEPAGSYQNVVLDKLKTKYIVLKGAEPSPQQPSKPEGAGGDEPLTLAKHVLYPLENVQLGWNNSDWFVGCGMVNMGNTCYLNSTLQALFHVPALVNWLISDKQHMAKCEESGGFCIICAMRKTLQDSQNRAVASIRPFLIYNKLRVVCRNLIPGRQEDAHEFLRYLVEAMEKAYLSRFKNHTEFDSRTKETTPLNQILGGYLRSAVRCLACGHVSTTFQHFQDLLLDIRKAQTLDEALQSYFSREKLDDESYRCEACQKKVPATKQFFLERAPMVLCIQLKRFSISNNKITKHIQFRQRLELTRYARHKPNVPLVYRLVALVTHMGPTVSCGHYTAVAQAPSGNFYQFDDSMVRPISHQGVFNTNAYIMLYELESAPFAQKPSTITTNKLKTLPSNPSSSSSSSCSTQVKNNNNNNTKEQTFLNNIKPNGLTSSKVYGPELPAAMNGLVNGNSSRNDSSSPSSSDSETETVKSDTERLLLPAPSMPLISKIPEKPPARDDTTTKSPPVLKPQNRPSPATFKTTSAAAAAAAAPSVTKLVPYEMDDSSNCSDESSCSRAENDTTRVTTKATTAGEWKVTTFIPKTNNTMAATTTTQQQQQEEGGKSWERKKSENNNSNTVGELMRMSHSGYGAPVTSWNGTRAQLDKEVNSERREERKRALCDNGEQQGRAKHPKLNNSHGASYKSNPGYNPIQEFHNAKNWGQSNGSHYRPFFNGGNRHRRNFHHKNYHKNNFRFRH